MKKTTTGLAVTLMAALPLAAVAQTPATHVAHLLDPSQTSIIHLLHQPSVVNSGRIAAQSPIASVAYAYNQPVRLAHDYAPGWAKKSMPAGTMGYFSGTFSQSYGDGTYTSYCLFGAPDGNGNPYAKPFCYMDNLGKLFGKSKAGAMDVSSNIQTSYSSSTVPVDPPEVTATNDAIAHDFHIDISFKRWFKDYRGTTGIVVYFKSEGRIVDESFLAVDSDNVLRIQLGDGVLTLQIDPADQDHVIVGFIKA